MKRYINVLMATFLSQVAFANPAEVISTTPPSDPAHVRDILTIEQMCSTFKNVDMGRKSTIECRMKQSGSKKIVEIRATNELGTLSISANAQDPMNVEFYGDPMYYYTNNLNQRIVVRFDQVNTGVRRTNEGTFIDGYYRADIRLQNGKQFIRVGAYIQDFGTQ